MKKEDEREYEGVHSRLDFFWSDYSRFQTFLNRKDRVREVLRIRDAFNSLRYVLFECFGVKDTHHPVYELVSLESELDFDASILLAFGGYYKQALMCLRNVFELPYCAMYYDNHREEYSLWKKGQRRSPSFSKNILEFVFKETNLREHKDRWKPKIKSQYTYLSQFVHTSAIDKTELWKGRDNVPRFLPRSFDRWFDDLKNVSRIVTLSSIVQWGQPMRFVLRKDKSGMRNEIASLLEEEDLKDLDL